MITTFYIIYCLHYFNSYTQTGLNSSQGIPISTSLSLLPLKCNFICHYFLMNMHNKIFWKNKFFFNPKKETLCFSHFSSENYVCDNRDYIEASKHGILNSIYFKVADMRVCWRVHRLTSYLLLTFFFFLLIGSKYSNTNRSMWIPRRIGKNKSYFVTFHESIIVILWTFQLNLVYSVESLHKNLRGHQKRFK